MKKSLLCTVAAGFMFAASPAFAVDIPVQVTGAPPQDISSVTLVLNAGTPSETTYEAEKDDRGGGYFTVDVGDLDLTGMGNAFTAEVAMRDGTVVRKPAYFSNGVLVIDAMPAGRSSGPSDAPSNIMHVPSGLYLGGGYHIERIKTSTPYEGGTVVIDDMGVFSDAGVNTIAPTGTLNGFTIFGGYRPDKLGLDLSVEYTHATNSSDFSSQFSPSASNETIGFAFYYNDSMYGSGVGGLDGSIDTTGYVHQKLDRLDVTVGMTFMDFLRNNDRGRIYPVLGFTHEEYVQWGDLFSILDSEYGTITNEQSIWQSNESLGPNIGVEYSWNWGENRGDLFFLNFTYQPRWNDVSIVADEHVVSQIDFFDLDLMQTFIYDETEFFNGYDASIGLSFGIPSFDHVSIGVEAGIRRRALLQFGQMSDGYGRPAVVFNEADTSPYGSVRLSVSF